MDPGFLLIENFARFAAVVGLILAAPLFVIPGTISLFIIEPAMGDPNRSATAAQRRHQTCDSLLKAQLIFQGDRNASNP